MLLLATSRKEKTNIQGEKKEGGGGGDMIFKLPDGNYQVDLTHNRRNYLTIGLSKLFTSLTFKWKKIIKIKSKQFL